MTYSERESAKRLITHLNREVGRLTNMGRVYEAGTRARWRDVVAKLMTETKGGVSEVQSKSD